MPGLATHCASPGELSAWLDENARDAVVGIDVSGNWRWGTGDLTGLALATAAGAAAWVDVAELTPADDAALASWFTDAN